MTRQRRRWTTMRLCQLVDNPFSPLRFGAEIRGGRSVLAVCFVVFDNSRLAPWTPTNGTRPFN
jgi:hypothetical protein